MGARWYSYLAAQLVFRAHAFTSLPFDTRACVGDRVRGPCDARGPLACGGRLGSRSIDWVVR